MNHNGVFLVARPTIGGEPKIIGEFYRSRSDGSVPDLKSGDEAEILRILSTLYPFRLEGNTIYNHSDFEFLRKRFGITNSCTWLIKGVTTTYYTPFLCVKTGERIRFAYPKPPEPILSPVFTQKSFLIFYPYENPERRAKLFRAVLGRSKTLESFIPVLPGYRISGDVEKISTFSTRYLLRCGFLIENIIRINTLDNHTNIIEDSLDKIKALKEIGFFTDTKSRICIACFSNDIKNITSAIRKLRKTQPKIQNTELFCRFRFFVEPTYNDFPNCINDSESRLP